jgi:GntR family transcriptional regulator
MSPRGAYDRPWRVIADDLRRKIAAGRWQAGDRLPTKAQLQLDYGGVAKSTIAAAVRQLRQEGLVVVRGNSLYVDHAEAHPDSRAQPRE